MGIEPTKPLLAQSFIGFEDRARHQSEKRFRRRSYNGAGRAARASGDSGMGTGARPAG